MTPTADRGTFLLALAERIDLLREPDEDYSNLEDAADLLAWIDANRPPHNEQFGGTR